MLTAKSTDIAGSSAVSHSVREFIVENFLLGNDNGFAGNESLLESGIVDSTGIMQVVAFLEETFSIVIADEDMVADNLETIERIVDFVERKRAFQDAA
jgi:acyl carrier protein